MVRKTLLALSVSVSGAPPSAAHRFHWAAD